MNSKQRFRTRLVLGAIIAAAGVLASSLYSTSIVKGGEYAAKANAQYARPDAALFDRGKIFFSSHSGREGSEAAATLGAGYLIYMNPKLVSDPSGTYSALSQYVEVDRSSFMSKASKANDPYEELARKVPEKTALSVKALSLSGIGIAKETWRLYPGGTLAAHELGVVGQNAASSTLSGKYGLEKSYDKVLSRQSSDSSVNVYARIFSDIAGTVFGSADSGDIVTTIEPTVQAYLEKLLSDTEGHWQPDEIGGIIMDPTTGEIFAMASLPSFDPNNSGAVKRVSILSNPLVEHVYEMGSIMKPLTMAIALDSGAVRPNSTYDDVGCMMVDDRRICNYDGKARGVVSIQEILLQSLNIGSAKMALKVGAASFGRYFEDLGLSSRSGIDLPDEGKPLVKDLKRSPDIDIATASYGQGVAVPPVVMVRSLSALANGGYLVKPHLVKEIDYLDGRKQKLKGDKEGPFLKEETVSQVRDILVKVVDTELGDGALKRERYAVAAKTGTAQIADPVNGGYYGDRYLHSFFGFFPAYKPRFVVFLYQVYPKGAKYASETLTKPFDELTGFLLNYYDVPPDR